MTPATIAEAVEQIDELTAQLAGCRDLIAELVGIIDQIRTERDTWRAAAS